MVDWKAMAGPWYSALGFFVLSGLNVILDLPKIQGMRI